MPLPPALAAKLAKRGLILSKTKIPGKDPKKNYKGSSGCPNKYNIYHNCTYWCDTQWKGVSIPDPKYVKKMHKMLMKYPLPHNWMEVFDKGVGRYYYWDMESDLVSWLPPKHPKAIKTEPAAKVRERLQQEQLHNAVEESKAEERDKEERRRHRHGDRKDRDRGRDDRRHRHDDKDRHRKSRKVDILDPMDPAAYSDVPQGTWSDGLENNKTRADSTASGVLFQQRPYPAPGEVLASNKSKSKKSFD